MPQVSSASEAFALMGESFDAGRAAGVNGTIQMDLTGEGGGTWSIKLADGTFELIDGAVESPTTLIGVPAGDASCLPHDATRNATSSGTALFMVTPPTTVY